MTKTISTTDAREQLADLLDAVSAGEEIVLERHGKPEFVIVRSSDIEALRQTAQRWEAFERLEALRERVAARNRDLDSQAIEDLADRVSHDAVDCLAEDGHLQFERDRHD